LIDGNDMTNVLKHLTRPFTYPKLDREVREFGSVCATVANGVVYFQDQWLLYYGAADKRIGPAICRPEGPPRK